MITETSSTTAQPHATRLMISKAPWRGKDNYITATLIRCSSITNLPVDPASWIVAEDFDSPLPQDAVASNNTKWAADAFKLLA
jgi:hypothetical protein